MQAKQFNCPYCGGIIDSDCSNREFIFCSYCGQRIQLDDEKKEFTYNRNINVNKYTHKKYTNDAEVITAQNKEKENKRAWIYIILSTIVLICILLGMHFSSAYKEMMAQKSGKISAGYYGDLIGENYKTVKAHFESAGFTNIDLIDLDDSGLMIWKKDEVETISVAGNTSFNSDDWFEPDAKVVISYH